MVKRMLGSEMPLRLQQDAKARFVHRFTREHKPQWANKPWKHDDQGNAIAYPVQFDSDKDWLEHTFFVVKNDESAFADNYSSCGCTPTWPDNPELRIGR